MTLLNRESSVCFQWSVIFSELHYGCCKCAWFTNKLSRPDYQWKRQRIRANILIRVRHGVVMIACVTTGVNPTGSSIRCANERRGWKWEVTERFQIPHLIVSRPSTHINENQSINLNSMAFCKCMKYCKWQKDSDCILLWLLNFELGDEWSPPVLTSMEWWWFGMTHTCLWKVRHKDSRAQAQDCIHVQMHGRLLKHFCCANVAQWPP